MVKNLPAMQETQVQFLHWEDNPRGGNDNLLQYLAWEIPGLEEPCQPGTVHGVTKSWS